MRLSEHIASDSYTQNAPRSMPASVVVTERVGGEHGLNEEEQSNGPDRMAFRK